VEPGEQRIVAAAPFKAPAVEARLNDIVQRIPDSGARGTVGSEDQVLEALAQRPVDVPGEDRVDPTSSDNTSPGLSTL
jgi:hypothetical protein